MWILKDRKRLEVKDVFNNSNELLEYIKKENDKINTKNERIIKQIKDMYNRMVVEDGLIKFNRFSRWYPKQMGFKQKNILQTEFWLERGWSEEETNKTISNIMIDRAGKSSHTKRKNKNYIIINEITKFKYKTVEFESSVHPICNHCGTNLDLHKVNVHNRVDEFFYRIDGCSNNECKSHNMNKTDKYKTYLPDDVANYKLEELSKIINESNPLCINYWLRKGLSEDESKLEISKIQSYNSKKVKNRFIPSRENLKELGYSNEEIRDILLTPSSVEFWLKKGYSRDDAKIMVTKNQSNAAKYVNYEKRLLPSNIDYWINKGLNYQQAKDKVKKSQTTFSKEICIQKYGEEEGLKRFVDRQNKWLSNITRNNFSIISQELFWSILKTGEVINDEVYFATYKNGELDDSGVNNEYRLKLNTSFILPDFFVKNKGKIIEFDGTYYHRPTPENLLRESIRDKNIINSGYKVLHISESEYKKDKQSVLYKCLDFLDKL